MERVKFTKAVGAGNDFIIVHEEQIPESLIEHSPRFCDRKYGIGADGILFITPSKGADFAMRIINADGSEAEMCGNGIRCAAVWAYQKKLVGTKTMKIQTLAGVMEVTLNDVGVKVQMPDPTEIKLHQEIEIEEDRFIYHSLNTGVPHIVIFETELDRQNVHHVGRLLRRHERFQPKGTNVNFVQILEKNRIKVRTYERGVEAETLACGTGATASALAAHFIKGLSSPVEVLTSGHEQLRIDFSLDSDKKKVFMTGPVEIVYEGNIII